MTDQPALTFRKSSFSASNGSCVEFAEAPDGFILVRDSKDPDGARLRFTRAEIDAWLLGAKAGEFDDLA